MKAMVLTGIRQMKMVEVPDPVIVNDTDVLIKMKTVGVCGSDIHYYTTGKIGTQIVKYPYSVGHEGAGIVIKTGRTVKDLKPGQRIAIEPAMPCFICDQCLSGREHTCRNLKFLGSPGQADGCLSEFIVMPETSCLPISQQMSFDQAVISEPLAIGIYAVKKSIPIMNAKAGILGFGPIGMSVLLALLSQGAAKVYVTDKIDHRLAMAKKTGAHWTGNPQNMNIVNKIKEVEPLSLDVIFECCGQQEAMDQAVELIKPGGKIMIIGIPEFENWILNTHEIRRKELTLTNVRRQVHCTHEALEMMDNHILDVSLMPTHHFSFTRTKEAFDLVAEYKDGVMKAMIEFE
jgi:L-iditol 2-dehydrogenase